MKLREGEGGAELISRLHFVFNNQNESLNKKEKLRENQSEIIAHKLAYSPYTGG